MSDVAIYWGGGGRPLNAVPVVKADLTGSGVMVALYPDPALAREIALPGGEDPKQIHLTLTFHGEAIEFPLTAVEKLRRTVAAWATRIPKLTGEISGVGLFTAGEKPVTYLSADIPGLPLARAELVAALTRAGIPPDMKHGYTPHMTLAYEDRTPEVPNDIGGTPLTFTHAHVVVGSAHMPVKLTGMTTRDKGLDRMVKSVLTSEAREKLRTSDFALPGRRYPIHDIAHARNALARVAQFGSPEEKAKVRAAVYRRYPALKRTK